MNSLVIFQNCRSLSSLLLWN